MLNVKEKLISICENSCPDNVYLQGTLNPDEAYPDKFITFFITDSDLAAYYDNGANKVDWFISVMIYANDPDVLMDTVGEVFYGLKNADFIPQGLGYDLPSGIETHTGWALDFIYSEYGQI